MSHKELMCLFLVCVLLSTFLFVAWEETGAQSNQLILEKEQHWETYGVGGTCSYGNNLFLKDLNGDGVTEILTGGAMYWIVNGKETASSAPLKVWHWDGKNLTLRTSYNWNSTGISRSSSCVYAADFDGDGYSEIVTGSEMSNGSGNYLQLGIWRWDESNLVLLSHTEWEVMGGASISSIAVNDLNNDGKAEIITGRAFYGKKSGAQLRIWHLNDNRLVLANSVEWCAVKDASVRSVGAIDVDGDGVTEIVTCGYDNDLQNSTGQLRLWTWNGIALALKDNEEWRMTQGHMLTIAGGVMGNTVANALDVGDVDGDGRSEIVTGGFTYDGTHANAQIVVWRWNGTTLTKADASDWYTKDINEVKSVSINDVDGDGTKEIVTSGFTASSGSFYSGSPQMGQLRVWAWNGEKLTLKRSQDWAEGDGSVAWSVRTGDVDKDNVTEMVTLGCMNVGNRSVDVGVLCDPDMRVWSIPQEPASPPYAVFGAIGIVAATAIVVAFILLRKKQH